MSTSILQIASAVPLIIAALAIALLGVRQIYAFSTECMSDEERVNSLVFVVILMAFSGAGFFLAAVILKMAGAQ